MRADSATVANVSLRNTTTVISDSDAASTASSGAWGHLPLAGDSPSVPRRRRMVWAMARAPVSSAARAISPCGASVAVSIATTIATAAGASRPSPIARSTSIHVTSTPKAISGSGRRPLLNGSQAARKTAPAVSTATRFSARPPLPGPSRRRAQWPMISQHPIPASVAGSRIQTPAVLTVAILDSTARYQSNGASVVPK